MNKIVIEEIKTRMVSTLTPKQLDFLEVVLLDVFNIPANETKKDFIQSFLFAKKSEGRSDRTITYYTQVLRSFERLIKDKVEDIRFATTEELRYYLYEYQTQSGCSAVNIDNMRRILSSFYIWLENENYILKSPMKRIAKLKIPSTLKSVYSDEEVIKLRESFLPEQRDLAIFDLLSSSGLRVGELVALNKNDIDLENQSAIVYGKGAKERCIYFDAKTKVSIQKYMEQRKDSNEALFVTNRKYTESRINRRISINLVEKIIRNVGNKNQINAYPHKFRRTIATKAIDKGMPIEQVQVLLGHTKIDTTLKYAQVQQKNVLFSYQKFIG